MVSRDGERASGPVAPLAKAVVPGETVTLLEVSDLWNALVSWKLEADLVATLETTGLKARYRNQLSWKSSRAPDETHR